MVGPDLRRFLCQAFATALFSLAGAATAANAQAVSFAGAQSDLTTSLSSPYGVAVDARGDVFVADSGNGRILEFPVDRAGPFAVPTSGLPTGSSASTAVGVDPFGDVFVVDTNDNRLVEIPPGVEQFTLTNASGLNTPIGLAVIPGNVYIADLGNNRVVKVPVQGGSESTVPITGLSQPYDVAVDSLGDLLIADWGNNRVIRYSPATTQFNVVASGLNGPQGVAVDSAGNTFLSDSGNNRVLMVPGGGGDPIPVGSGFSMPTDLAIDSAESLYIADTSNNRVVQLQLQSVNFGAAGICTAQQTAPQSCGKLITLTFNVTASGTLGPTQTRTLGTTGLDFLVSGSGSCSGAATQGTQCSVDVVFAPRFAGLRKGAVEITDSMGKVIATTYVSGYGLGPQIAYGSGAQSVVGSGLNEPLGLAADESGNLYIADDFNNRVLKVTSKGVQTTVGTGFSKPAALALDGAGNVFVADWGNNRVVKVPADGSAQSVVAAGLAGPQSVAVDRAGNLFIADTNSSRILEVPASGAPQLEIGTGFSFPHGVIVDFAGNVFVADFGNKRVVEVPAGCTSADCQVTIGTGFSGPQGLVLDGAGNLLVADYYNDRVVEIPADGSSPRTVGSNLKGPQDLAMDAAGNLFISESGVNSVVRLSRSAPSQLVFPTRTLVNTPDSPDGPLTLEIENIGNQPLVFATPGSGSNPSYSSGFPANTGDTNLCRAALNLQPGSTCDLSMEFKPIFGGLNNGFVQMTDNALNQVNATQSISLLGTGFQKQTISFPPITTTEYALSKLALKATATSALAVVFASTTAKVCTVAGATAKLLAGGTCTIIASQPGNIAYSAAPAVSRSFTVLRINQTVAFPAIAAKEHALTSLKLKATASSGLAVSLASTTTRICTVAAGVASLHSIGTCTVTASQSGNSIYKAAASVSRSFKVLGASQTIAFAAIAAQKAGGKIALKATASSKLAVTFASATPAVCKVSGTSAVMVSAGTCSITASQKGNQVYAAAPPVKRSFPVTKHS